MEKPPHIFWNLTHFAVANVEHYGSRFEEVKKLSLEIESEIPLGRYPLVLMKPFPPHGRPGENLAKLRSLGADNIESIWVFCTPDDSQSARLEIRTRTPGPTFFVRCARVAGVPGCNEKQIDSDAVGS